MSPERFLDEYIYASKRRISRNIAYGSQLATGLEANEASGDPLLDLMASRLPKFALMDQPIEDPNGTEVWFERDKRTVRVPVLENKDGDIPILAVPDTAREDYSAFKEYKTSVRKWTQRMADESGQITFYTTSIWLAKRIIPEDIELVNVQTAYDEQGRLTVTNEMFRYQTKRTMADVIRMTKRMRKAWAGIQELCEKELLPTT